MRGLIFFVASIVALAATQTSCAASPSGKIAGAYDIMICSGACSFDKSANAVFKGRVVLFAKPLKETELRRFDEDLLRHQQANAINACFTLDTAGKPSSDLRAKRIGLTSGRTKEGSIYFRCWLSSLGDWNQGGPGRYGILLGSWS